MKDLSMVALSVKIFLTASAANNLTSSSGVVCLACSWMHSNSCFLCRCRHFLLQEIAPQVRKSKCSHIVRLFVNLWRIWIAFLSDCTWQLCFMVITTRKRNCEVENHLWRKRKGLRLAMLTINGKDEMLKEKDNFLNHSFRFLVDSRVYQYAMLTLEFSS